jgi:hypothetical protein
VTVFLKFVKTMGIILVVVCGVGVYPLYVWKGPDWVVAAAVGCAICTLNALVGGGVALWAMNKNHTTFFAAVFGGMGLRIFIVVTFFLIAVKVVKLHIYSLTLSMFLFYVIFQILEIRLFARCSSGDTQRAEGT